LAVVLFLAPVLAALTADSASTMPTNALSHEKSPYLLQHAQPGELAAVGTGCVEKARREN
jgi:hypothetical protein